ncbi:type IV pilus assembly protein PilE [Andreprevotia lacus DSM 23236]|jgi:type IV pilus assembly protein PilE|uniref:Type IV pilus assembly protein PilE n=1 Tax=Andreprevotia lacus DSM 23236 TaxID=1121001 RepID=A0A1W1XC72_9NEIS|nr:type IV pilin protein [Andreprevotia lacus]SMC21121.1 type IV pilus assembly protein PilE [Andreprevotia lacus DSM 23236]
MAKLDNNATAQAGFTLIELMVAISVVAILAAIAFPAYSEYVRRGKLVEAPTELAASRLRIEQYYQDNRQFNSGSGTTCGVSMTSTSQNFSYTCTAGSTSYTITATGVTGKQTAGFTYTLDQDNNKKTTLFKGTTSSKTCWMLKGNEC